MYQASVCHLDVSWFNVFLNHGEGGVQSDRQHSRAELGADTADRPFLYKTVHPPKGATFESTSLLTDLDYLIDLQNADPHPLRLTTGTPMFIAAECASAPNTNYNAELGCERLQTALKEIQNDELGGTSFSPAFPGGDADFLTKLERVLEEEVPTRSQALDNRVPRNQEVFMHRFYHDVESVFWIFLWAFACAHPLDAECTDDSRSILNFKYFCEDIRHHIVKDGRTEARRASWLYFHRISVLFHPRIAVSEKIFDRMSRYLSVPWHLYDPEKIDETHAFVAFRRLILNALIRSDPEYLDLPLNTETPRSTIASDKVVPKRKLIAQVQSAKANNAPGTLVQVLEESERCTGAATASRFTCSHTILRSAAASISSFRLTRGAKRKLESTGSDEDEQPTKKHVNRLHLTQR